MVNITEAVRRVKDDLPRMLEPHVDHALEHRGGPARRKRLLPPLATILLFVRQVLHGNTAITHLRHLSPLDFTAAAYCKARQRLGLEVLEAVGRAVGRELRSAADDACRWRGHRVWRADGSSFSMPDTPELQRRFGQHGAQKPGATGNYESRVSRWADLRDRVPIMQGADRVDRPACESHPNQGDPT